MSATFLHQQLQDNLAKLQTSFHVEKDGDTENLIKQLVAGGGFDGSNDEEQAAAAAEVTSWFDERRQRLINLAKKYDKYSDIVTELKEDVERQTSQEHQEGKIKSILAKLENDGNDEDGNNDSDGGCIYNNKRYELEIRTKLGFPDEETGAAGEGVANKNGDGNENDDEDLVVVGDGRKQKRQAGALTCPIMGTLLEDPVKSTRCGHAYSKAAIMSHLRIKSCCPVAGCVIKDMTANQLQPDLELVQLVRKAKRREDARREHLSLSQACLDIDDSFENEDDENEEEEDSTMAVKHEY